MVSLEFFIDIIRRERDFLNPFRPSLELTHPLIQWVPGLFPGIKSGRGVTLTTHLHLAPMLKKE
jgi:hypothetical protein